MHEMHMDGKYISDIKHSTLDPKWSFVVGGIFIRYMVCIKMVLNGFYGLRLKPNMI